MLAGNNVGTVDTESFARIRILNFRCQLLSQGMEVSSINVEGPVPRRHPSQMCNAYPIPPPLLPPAEARLLPPEAASSQKWEWTWDLLAFVFLVWSCGLWVGCVRGRGAVLPRSIGKGDE